MGDLGNQLYDKGTVDPVHLGATAAAGAAFGWLGGGLDEAPLPSQAGVGVVLGFTGDFYIDWAYGNLWNSSASAAELSSCAPAGGSR